MSKIVLDKREHKNKGDDIMFKKFFDTVKLNAQVKVMREALNTIATSSELCLELMEHPMKRQDNIKELLKDINKTCKKCI